MKRKTGPEIIVLISLTAAGLLFGACAGVEPIKDPLMSLRGSLAEEAGPLEEVRLPQTGPFISEYFANADRLEPEYRFPGARCLGTINAVGYRLGIVLLEPPAGKDARGTIIAVHGYGGSSLLNLSALYRLAEDGWSVLAVDLPGHGFSTGPSREIRHFKEYGDCVAGVIRWLNFQTRFDLRRPLVLLGHSTGGSAVLEALWNDPSGVDRAVLIAPLIKPTFFRPIFSGIGHFFEGSGRKLSGPPRYLESSSLPLYWPEAYLNWRAGLPRRPVLDLPVLIVQGQADTAIQWKSGLKFLGRMLRRPLMVILPGRGHILLDRGPAQAETLDAVRKYFELVE